MIARERGVDRELEREIKGMMKIVEKRSKHSNKNFNGI